MSKKEKNYNPEHNELRTELEVPEEDIYGITALKPIQQRFIHLYLTGMYDNTKLSQLLNVHVNTINSWLRREDVKSIITEFQKDEHEIVESQLKALRNKAIQTMGGLMESPIDNVRYQASKDILDRTGHKQAQKHEIKKEVYTFEAQMNEIIQNTISDDLIDFTVEDVEEVENED